MPHGTGRPFRQFGFVGTAQHDLFLDIPHDGVPSGVRLPHALIERRLTWQGQHAGFLGPAHDQLLVARDHDAPPFRMDTFRLPAGLDPARN